MTKTSQDIALRLVPNKTRIRDSDGFIATVRYVGPVASAKKSEELYAGVEWDDRTRGIHDGSVICRKTNQIVRHFSLSEPCPTGGSFLKLSKIDLGVELNLKLIQSRYVNPDAPLVAPNNILPYSARTSSGRDKPIEFLGEMQVRKRQQLEHLTDISLRGMGLSSIASGEERADLVRTFEHLQELDVAGNLFSDWDALFEILRVFPKLVWLSFASNKIYDIPSDMEVTHGEFSCLRVLNLNRCSIGSFETILVLDKLCPNLEELCIAYSNLSDMKIEENGWGMSNMNEFQHLMLLDCSNCQLTSWKDQIQRLSRWPNLETLILDNNNLRSVDIDTKTADHDFQALKNLQIAGTSISTWKDMEGLSHLPSLDTIRFRNCPLTDKIGTGEARAGTIARLPQIQFLNASQITPKERLEAERRYVSTVSRELLSMQPPKSDSLDKADDPELSVMGMFKKLGLDEKYPRFEELVDKHKESMMLVVQSQSTASSTISQNVVDVTIRSMVAESCTIEPLKKRLPSSLKVARLKTMCSRAFGLDVSLQVLYFRNEGDAFPNELDDDENKISYYGVGDGAEILIHEIDLKAQEDEERRKAKLRNQKVEEQERHSNTIHAMRQSEIRAQISAAAVNDTTTRNVTVSQHAYLKPHPNFTTVLLTERKHAKTIKTVLEKLKLLDKKFRLCDLDESSFSEFMPHWGYDSCQPLTLWSSPGLYIAIPVHASCIQHKQEISIGNSLYNISHLILGYAKQACPFSSSVLGNTRGNVIISSSLVSSNDGDQQKLHSNVVKNILCQALLDSHELMSSNQGQLCNVIAELPACVIPPKLELIGDDRTLVIPCRALNPLADKIFHAFLKGILGEGQQINDFMVRLWEMLAVAYHSRRVVRCGEIDPKSKVRESGHSLLWIDPDFEKSLIEEHGPESNGWITVTEQGIKQSFDLTKIMFSRGNISEKIRFGKLVNEGDLVLDLYSGIGYYSLPALVHGKARYVYACEWNPCAISFLRYNLEQNGVSDRASVVEGDCRIRLVEEELVHLDFDRVSLGLLPSSEGGWKTAVGALRKDKGGWLHIHGNVSLKERDIWVLWMCKRLSEIYSEIYNIGSKLIWVLCANVEKVKSFAPKVDHLVADVFIGPGLPPDLMVNAETECRVGMINKDNIFIPTPDDIKSPSCALGNGVLNQPWMM